MWVSKYCIVYHFSLFGWTHICLLNNFYANLDYVLHFWKALITLKKGSKLIKYSRKGKPKIREFRLSSVSLCVWLCGIGVHFLSTGWEQNSLLFFSLQDETVLVWYSHSKEKCLKLSAVSKIIPGQRTVS
jgi:hypothetical protein